MILHVDFVIDAAEVLIEFESIQFESNVDVTTDIFVPVNSDSRSVCVVDGPRLVLQLLSQDVGELDWWHYTPQ